MSPCNKVPGDVGIGYAKMELDTFSYATQQRDINPIYS